jgi:hypothetical protein
VRGSRTKRAALLACDLTSPTRSDGAATSRGVWPLGRMFRTKLRLAFHGMWWDRGHLQQYDPAEGSWSRVFGLDSSLLLPTILADLTRRDIATMTMAVRSHSRALERSYPGRILQKGSSRKAAGTSIIPRVSLLVARNQPILSNWLAACVGGPVRRGFTTFVGEQMLQRPASSRSHR